ncbi:putative ABC transporter, periplasmic binding protein [Desulfosarcina variabilis str. Montpellier]|uniref:ABC transporter substrate-binding protein n=1 Tax=Desulfosarcina variabilis TaxID=2300 RepID=UPI003AFB517E
MKKTKTPSCFKYVLLFLFLGIGVDQTLALGKQNEVIITDAMGRTVTIAQPVQRIAFSGTCLGEALKIMGVWDKVVGRGYMIAPDKKLYPGIEDIPVFATDTPGPYNVNYEKLLALDVDLLLTIQTHSTGFEEMNNKIKSRIKVVALDMFLPETVKSNFEILAAIFDGGTKAKAYLDWHDHIVKTIVAKTSGLTRAQRKRFFLNWSFGGAADFTTISDQFPGMVATNDILGGINIAANFSSMWGPTVDPEWLIQQKIDIIICQGLNHGAYGSTVDDPSKIASYREQIMALPAFASSKAVKQGNVFMIASQFMFSPGLPLYLAYVAKWFHPELFPDLEPQTLHQEYLTRFLHADVDLSRRGVFAYPK